jgi:hypothetical protein
LIPKICPTTPIKCDVIVGDVAPESIKRHLFDSPLNKPMAVVHQSKDDVAMVAADALTNGTTEQQPLVNESVKIPKVEIKAADTPAPTSTAAILEKGVEEEESLRVQSTGYKLDCLDDALATQSPRSDIANSAIGDAEPKEEAVQSAGYNLDFLDDPNFDPFATKSSGIRNSFGTSQPEPLITAATTSAADNEPKEEAVPAVGAATKRTKPAPSKAPPSSGGSDAPAKEEKKKKPLPPKPWLKKKLSAAAKPKDEEEDIVIFMPDKKSASNKEDIVGEAKPAEEQLPSQSGPAAAVNTPEKVASKEAVPAPVAKEAVSAPAAKEAVPAPAAATASNSPPLRRKAAPKSSGYNVNFDDPDFNPFETKSKVVNNFDDKVSMSISFFACNSLLKHQLSCCALLLLASSIHRLSTNYTSSL